MRGTSRLGVLREPNYRRFFLGRTISLVGDGMAPVAIAFAVLDLTGSATDLGIVLAAHSVVITALVLVGGVVADRVSPRLAMLRADLVSAASIGGIALLLLTGVAEIWQLAALYAIAGGATAFFNPASNAIVPQVVPGPRLQEGTALLNVSRNAGKVAGPALAGVLLALGSPGAALAVDAATFAASAAFLAGVRAPRLRDAAAESAFFSELRHGWREFASRDWLVAVVLSAAISNALFFAAFQVLGPTVAEDALGGSSSWALIAAFWGVGGILGGALALAVRPRRPLLLGESTIVLLGAPIALLAIPAATVAIAIGALVAGTATGLAVVLYETALVEQVPQEALSRVLAYDWFGSLALEPLGLVLVGPIAAGIGVSTTLAIAAVVLTACQLAVLLVPGVRRLERNPAAGPVVPRLRPVEAGD
jgi:MFS family permease